jgi:hypothetical protein
MPDRTKRATRPLLILACVLGAMSLAACSDTGSTQATGSEAAKARSPLASPPPAMMTPHGY